MFTGDADLSRRLLSLPCVGKALDAELHQLSSYSHVAFTSKNGIYAVVSRLQQLYGSREAAADQLRKAACWALGADAAMLRELGVEALTPPKVKICRCSSTQGCLGRHHRLDSFGCCRCDQRDSMNVVRGCQRA